MNHSRMLQRVLMSVIVASFALSTAATQAATVSVLADLIASNGSITNGDKTFTDFGYSSTGEMPPATRVNVEPTTDQKGNFGLRFSGAFTDAPPNGGSDALITYKVTAGPGRLISDAHLSANIPAGSNGFMGITESFNGATDSLILSINAIQHSDWGDFLTPQKMVEVEKNILAFATGPIWPTMSFVDQTFSQVPEPTTLVLSFVGMAGLGLMWRRPRQA